MLDVVLVVELAPLIELGEALVVLSVLDELELALVVELVFPLVVVVVVVVLVVPVEVVVPLFVDVPADVVEFVVVVVFAASGVLVELAVMVSSFTTPLLKSRNLAINTFIGSIESAGSLHETVLLMPIFVAVTSALAPSGLLG